MVVATELIIAVDHVADFAHHPLDGLHRAYTISITVHHGDRSQVDVIDRNVGSSAVLLSMNVELGVLLEAIFNTHLQEMSESTCRERLFVPVALLLAPLASKMGAHFRLKLLPVFTMKSIQAKHIHFVS